MKNAFLVKEDRPKQGDVGTGARDDNPSKSKKAKLTARTESKPTSQQKVFAREAVLTRGRRAAGYHRSRRVNIYHHGETRASVFRGDGSMSTMLRNRPTSSSDDSVWVDCETCVDEGATVAVLERHRGGVFARVRTASGVEGWLKSAYLVVQNS